MRVWWMLLLVMACGGEVEGDDPGECSDGADNDQDGEFDCDDTDCIGSPDCEGTGVGLPTGLATGTTTGLLTGLAGGTTTGTTTSTGTPGGTPTQFAVSVTWSDDGYSPTDTDGDGFPDLGCNDSVRIQIADPLLDPTWEFGMAETNSLNGWTGEDCLNGYASFAFCHPIGIDHTLDEVNTCSVLDVVAGQRTYLDAEKDPFLTYYLSDGAGDCFTFGDDPSYYGTLGCSPI